MNSNQLRTSTQITPEAFRCRPCDPSIQCAGSTTIPSLRPKAFSLIMGRYNLAPQRVNQKATQLLSSKRLPNPPPWYHITSTVPPSSRLDRPPLQRSQTPGHKPPGGKKKSKLFKPLQLKYEEDRLRWEYFNDHPWELARPRVVLENDGRDAERWDWSVPLDHALNRPRAGEVNALGRRTDAEWDRVRRTQAGRPINGEA